MWSALDAQREKDKTVTWTAAVKWAHNIACGMDHLHDKKLNHLDLKSGNVLLTGTVFTSKGKMMAGVQSTAKIADFGNLRRAVVQPTQTQKTMTLTRTAFRCGLFPALAFGSLDSFCPPLFDSCWVKCVQRRGGAAS